MTLEITGSRIALSFDMAAASGWARLAAALGFLGVAWFYAGGLAAAAGLGTLQQVLLSLAALVGA